MVYVRTSWAVPSGWVDDRLAQAYDLIWQVQRDNADRDNADRDIEPEFTELLAKIEVADTALADALETKPSV